MPPNIEFVPIDFEVASLRDGLKAITFDATRPAFLSWLGVMVYLSEEAVDRVFRFVTSLPRSSEIVFTFNDPASADLGDPGPTSLAEMVAAQGESWRTLVKPDDLVRRLYALGFSSVKLLTSTEIDERYIGDRQDGILAPLRISIASAMV